MSEATRYNLADLFESVADVVPELEAIICAGKRLSYRELDERSTRLAHHLASQGIGAGDHVGLYQLNGAEYVESVYAALKIRAVPINVNYRYVEEELRYLFDDADLKGVIYHREFAPRLAAIRDKLPQLKVFVSIADGSDEDLSVLGSVDYEEALAAASPERDFPERSEDDHFIIYTGGTTGMPKGVVWRHEDLFFAGLGGGNPGGPPVESPGELARNATERYHMVMFPVPPLIHGAAQLASLIVANWGDKAVLLPRFDAREVWRLVQDEKVNTINIVGDAMGRPMAEELEAGSYDVSSLFALTSAGAVLSEAVKDLLKSKLENLMIMDNFGATEVGYMGTMGERVATKDASAGLRIIVNDRTAVLDEETLEIIEPGSGKVGRLAQRGWIPLGYYGDAEKTAETFVEKDGVRWVLLGDRGTPEGDGRVTVFGRGSVCINSGGEKIFPEEVESALKSHPAIYDAVVVGVPDERFGQRVAAVIQVRSGQEAPSAADVDAHCRQQVAGYKVPREVHAVPEILRSPAGKPDYRWGRELAEAGQHRID